MERIFISRLASPSTAFSIPKPRGFGQGDGFWETVLALLMHLIPTGIVLVVLAVSWRWEWIGAMLFMALGIW